MRHVSQPVLALLGLFRDRCSNSRRSGLGYSTATDRPGRKRLLHQPPFQQPALARVNAIATLSGGNCAEHTSMSQDDRAPRANPLPPGYAEPRLPICLGVALAEAVGVLTLTLTSKERARMSEPLK